MHIRFRTRGAKGSIKWRTAIVFRSTDNYGITKEKMFLLYPLNACRLYVFRKSAVLCMYLSFIHTLYAYWIMLQAFLIVTHFDYFIRTR